MVKKSCPAGQYLALLLEFSPRQGHQNHFAKRDTFGSPDDVDKRSVQKAFL